MVLLKQVCQREDFEIKASSCFQQGKFLVFCIVLVGKGLSFHLPPPETMPVSCSDVLLHHDVLLSLCNLSKNKHLFLNDALILVFYHCTKKRTNPPDTKYSLWEHRLQCLRNLSNLFSITFLVTIDKTLFKGEKV